MTNNGLKLYGIDVESSRNKGLQIVTVGSRNDGDQRLQARIMGKFVAAILRAATAEAPRGHDDRFAALAAVDRVYRHELARLLAPIFHAAILKTPHDRIEEKKALARWTNDQLRRFGLAIKCPTSGQGAFLMTSPGYDPSVGRLMLFWVTNDGTQHRATFHPASTQFRLMDDPSRRYVRREVS
jgi:hypothetical protein